LVLLHLRLVMDFSLRKNLHINRRLNRILLTDEYKVNSKLASQGVCLSTVLCLATIPILELALF
jgi:hypothetical protein